MTKDQWLKLAGQAFDLSVQQQKQYRDAQADNGRRDSRSLFQSNLFWKYQAVVTAQFYKLTDALQHATTDEDRQKRRLLFLSVLVSFLSRFVSLGDEDITTVDQRSNVRHRGIE